MKPISSERWKEAQEWELEFWNRENIPSPLWKRALRPLLVAVGLRPPRRAATYDDRNLWWRDRFDGYRALPVEVGHACELGCGPYTNMRLIAEGRSIRYVHLSDPLAASYVRYPNGHLARGAREGRWSVDFHPAEECPFRDGLFEITVLINVLDHVRDPLRCLDEAARITAPGGYFVFGQDLTEEGDRLPGNPGHPFVVSLAAVSPFLSTRFDEVQRRLVSREEMSEPEMHSGAIAFIGIKR